MSEEQRKYYIKETDGISSSVELWSTIRFPFEPTKELPKREFLEMRNSLGSAIKNFTSGNNTVLDAVYSSIQQEYFDIENVLFYNVGPGVFKHLCNKGFRFEQRIMPPPEVPLRLNGKARYYHHYSVANKDITSQYWKKEQRLAYWNNIPCTILNREDEAYFVWYAMKKGLVEVINKLPNPQSFSIQIKISVPTGKKINLSLFLKHLLDGVISSFHRHNGADIIEITNRLAEILGDNKSDVERLLMDSQMNVLGMRKLFHLRPQKLQWNPADNACMKAEVLLDNSEDSTLSLSGELFSIRHGS